MLCCTKQYNFSGVLALQPGIKCYRVTSLVKQFGSKMVAKFGHSAPWLPYESNAVNASQKKGLGVVTNPALTTACSGG